MTFDLIATAKSPLALSVGRATGNDLETLAFLPGRAVRGAVAQAYLDGGGSADSAGFRAIFLKGLVRFGDMRIGRAKVWPVSARACKLYPDDHPKVDLLLNAAAGIATGPECSVKDCGSKLEHPAGYYREGREAGGVKFARAQVATRRVAHVEIDPATLRASSGQFHSSRLICADQVFEGRVWAEGEGEAELRRVLVNERTLGIGRGKTRGQGRVNVRLIDGEARTDGALAESIGDFNAQATEKFPELARKVVFSCTLNSAAIVFDEWLMSRSYLRVEDLSPEAGDLAGYELIAWRARTTAISGWNAAAKLPKPEVMAIAAGSAFLFGRSADGVGRQSEYSRLAQLFARGEQRGVGERLEQGYGEVSFCDRIHTLLAVRDGI